MGARTRARRTRNRSLRSWRTNGGRKVHSRTGESARLRAPSGRATECRSEQHGGGESCPAVDGVRMRAREPPGAVSVLRVCLVCGAVGAARCPWAGRCARMEAAGWRRVSRDGTEAPLARLRTPLLCCAAREAASPLVRRSDGTTGRRSPAAGSRARRVGGCFLTRKKQTAGICLLSCVRPCGVRIAARP